MAKSMNVTDNLKTLSENIYNLRKKIGLTQESLAEKLNISFQAISKWENGQTAPDIMMLPLLSQIFGVSIDMLFGINPESNGKTGLSVDWDDDDTIRGLIFKNDKKCSFYSF
jgi:transcriptional regulator with XRE-family HTH domain